MKKNTQKLLHELIRSADSLIAGMSPGDKLDWLHNLSSDSRNKMFEKNAGCILPIKYMDAEVLQPYFVICNRSGMTDPEMIKIAIQKCKEEVGSSKVDQEHLLSTMRQLMRLYKMYSNGPVKCPKMAYLKGKATQRLNSLGQALQRIK